MLEQTNSNLLCETRKYEKLAEKEDTTIELKVVGIRIFHSHLHFYHID